MTELEEQMEDLKKEVKMSNNFLLKISNLMEQINKTMEDIKNGLRTKD